MSISFHLKRDCLTNLSVLSLHKGIVGIPFCVVLDQNGESFVAAITTDEPARGFRNEPDERQAEQGGEKLE